jgi:predicted nucleotidyltransferase
VSPGRVKIGSRFGFVLNLVNTRKINELQLMRVDQISAQIHNKWRQPRGEPIDPDASWSNFCYTAGMERDQAIARLKEHEAELRQLGIEHLYLFGSTARGEAREDSDVDLFFDHPVGSIGLYELMDVKETASRILGRKADIMTRRSLHRVLRDRIEASALQVF